MELGLLFHEASSPPQAYILQGCVHTLRINATCRKNEEQSLPQPLSVSIPKDMCLDWAARLMGQSKQASANNNNYHPAMLWLACHEPGAAPNIYTRIGLRTLYRGANAKALRLPVSRASCRTKYLHKAWGLYIWGLRPKQCNRQFQEPQASLHAKSKTTMFVGAKTRSRCQNRSLGSASHKSYTNNISLHQFV